MITKKDAIAIGAAIVAGMKSECERATSNEQKFSARGAAIYALDNVWYDVLPLKVRDKFLAIKGKGGVVEGRSSFFRQVGFN